MTKYGISDRGGVSFVFLLRCICIDTINGTTIGFLV